MCVAAGIRGSFLTKQFKVARKNGRIQRHFRFNSPNGVSDCTEHRACERCWILFSASVILQSQRSGVPSEHLSDLKSMPRIWRKRSDELLAVAPVDLENK